MNKQWSLKQMFAIIYFNGQSYILEPLMGEQIEDTYNRLWKIIQYQPRTEYDYEKLVDISKLWYYKNKCGCIYSDKNEKVIRLFDITSS